MFRKFLIAAGATATIAAASLAPTAASAAGGWHGHHGHHGWHGGWHRGWHGPAYGFAAPVYYGSSCYIVKRVVPTPFGPRVRRVTVCD